MLELKISTEIYKGILALTLNSQNNFCNWLCCLDLFVSVLEEMNKSLG